MTDDPAKLSDLNDRSRDIFRRLVETYLETGDPVGSRTLSRTLDKSLSAATIRNVMQDLEHLGLLGSPHVSAGRVPTQSGLRLFVDGLLEIGDVSEDERREIERAVGASASDAAARKADREEKSSGWACRRPSAWTTAASAGWPSVCPPATSGSSPPTTPPRSPLLQDAAGEPPLPLPTSPAPPRSGE